MAIKLAIEHDSGVTTEYHRVLKVHTEFADDEQGSYTVVIVGTYIDQAARDSGKSPVFHRQLRMPMAEMAGRNEAPTTTRIYKWIHKLDDFKEGVEL